VREGGSWREGDRVSALEMGEDGRLAFASGDDFLSLMIEAVDQRVRTAPKGGEKTDHGLLVCVALRERGDGRVMITQMLTTREDWMAVAVRGKG